MPSPSQSKFELLGEPYHWWLTAASMKEASELIFDAIVPTQRKPSQEDIDLERQGFKGAHPLHDLRSVYVLLVGFSLENLLKAEYMRLNSPSLADGKLPLAIREHDLLALCKVMGITLKPDERGMLGIASEATVSWGRYPGGLRHDVSMSPPECFDVDEFRHAFEAVYRQLTEVITKDWGD